MPTLSRRTTQLHRGRSFSVSMVRGTSLMPTCVFYIPLRPTPHFARAWRRVCTRIQHSDINDRSARSRTSSSSSACSSATIAASRWFTIRCVASFILGETSIVIAACACLPPCARARALDWSWDLHEPTNLHAPRQGRFEDTGRSRGLEPRLARHECVFPFREPYPCAHCALAC